MCPGTGGWAQLVAWLGGPVKTLSILQADVHHRPDAMAVVPVKSPRVVSDQVGNLLDTGTRVHEEAHSAVPEQVRETSFDPGGFAQVEEDLA